MAIQIDAIDKGLRTGYLWDIPESLPDAANPTKALLEDLRQKRILDKEIAVLSLEMEVFLVDRQAVITALKDQDRYIFLDLENDYKVIDRHKDIENLLQQIENEAKVLDFTADPTTCLATISGVIIDYPVVYYYDPTHDLKSGGETLMVYSVLWEKSKLYSFSVPVIALGDELIRKHLEKWKRRVGDMGLIVETKQEVVNSWVM